MLMRKTQYAWMALGGLICLFGLVLACKLRDGNKVVAQSEPLPMPNFKEPELFDPPPPSKTTKSASTPVDLKKPERDEGPSLIKTGSSSKPGDKPSKKKTASEPKPLEMPFPGLSGSRSVSSSPPTTKPTMPPTSTTIVPASFAPNTPTAFDPDKAKPTSQLEKKNAPKDSYLGGYGGYTSGGTSLPPPSVSPPSPPSPTHSSASSLPPLSSTVLTGTPPSPGAVSPPPSTSPKTAAPSTSLPSSVSSAPAPAWNAPAGVVPASSSDPIRALPGEPPLAPNPGPVQMYRAHASETLHDIARRTLGSGDRAGDLHKLNPSLKPEEPLRSGTMVRLPADACVQPDDPATVKALPLPRAKPAATKAKTLPLTGTYQCSLDEKGRLTLPRALRDQLGGSETVLVSPGTDKCLWLTNSAHLERLDERLEQSHANENDVRVFKRLYYAQTEKLTVNGEGRVSIPDRMTQFAGLQQEVVLVGIDDHFEVWDASRWRSYTQQKSSARAAVSADTE